MPQATQCQSSSKRRKVSRFKRDLQPGDAQYYFSPFEMTDQLSLKAFQVILVGEHLRNRLHGEEDPVIIRDRRYHLRMYPCCFVGRDMVDWLIRKGDANSRAGAVQCMNVLYEDNIIHHGKRIPRESGKVLQIAHKYYIYVTHTGFNLIVYQL